MEETEVPVVKGTARRIFSRSDNTSILKDPTINEKTERREARKRILLDRSFPFGKGQGCPLKKRSIGGSERDKWKEFGKSQGVEKKSR